MTTAIAASSAYIVNEWYFKIAINPPRKTTSKSVTWVIISLAYILIAKLMKAAIPEPVCENCRLINQNMQELVTPTSEPAHLHLQLWDSCMRQRNSRETWLPTFAAGTLSHPRKSELFASGSYFSTDLSGLCVYPQYDIKFTLWVKWAKTDSSVLHVHVANTATAQWHHLLCSRW